MGELIENTGVDEPRDVDWKRKKNKDNYKADILDHGPVLALGGFICCPLVFTA